MLNVGYPLDETLGIVNKMGGVIMFMLLCISCDDEFAKPVFTYHGPISRAENIETIYMEDGVVKMKISTLMVYEFVNGNKEFPEGVQVEFYEKGEIRSIIKAENAYSFEEKQQWRGQGKVSVHNLKTNHRLYTEELFWNIKTERIYTSKFFTVHLDNEILHGKGLESAQDLSDYTILEPTGEFELEEVSSQ